MSGGTGDSTGSGGLGLRASGPVSAKAESDQEKPLTPEELRRLAVEVMVLAIVIGWIAAVLGKTLLGLPQGFFNHIIIAFTLVGLLANRLLGALPWLQVKYGEDLIFLMVWTLAAVLFPSLREGEALPYWLLGHDVCFSTIAAMSLAFGLIYHVGRSAPIRFGPIGRMALKDTLIDVLFLAPVLLFGSSGR